MHIQIDQEEAKMILVALNLCEKFTGIEVSVDDTHRQLTAVTPAFKQLQNKIRKFAEL